MIIIIKPGCLEFFGLRSCQHSQRNTGFHTKILYCVYHFDHAVEILVGRIAPGRSHTKSAGAIALRIQRRLFDFVDRHQAFAFQPGIVPGALWTIRTVLRAGPGFNAQQRTNLHRIGIEVLPVRGLRLK